MAYPGEFLGIGGYGGTSKFLFSWDRVPGNHMAYFIDFLREKYRINWVKTAKIEKIDDNRTIKVSTEKNYLSLKLNDDKTRAILNINDIRSDEFDVRNQFGELNIYKQ